ncbi:MAG: FtsX-like permease family protein, partial [Methanomassiliicoccales archaeon]
NALRDWSFLIFYLAAIVIVLTLAISVITSVFGRRRTLVILRAIGLTRRQVSSVLLIEYILIGAAAFVIGIFSSLVVGVILHLSYQSTGSFETLSSPFSPTPWMILPLFVILISSFISTYITTTILWNRPVMEVIGYE